MMVEGTNADSKQEVGNRSLELREERSGWEL